MTLTLTSASGSLIELERSKILALLTDDDLVGELVKRGWLTKQTSGYTGLGGVAVTDAYWYESEVFDVEVEPGVARDD